MKSLYLLRHGKSDWDADYSADHERPLARRGEKAAAAVGKFLSGIDEVPDLILSSTAVRARTTVEIAAKKGSWDRTIEFRDDLYGASTQTVLYIINELSSDADTVMLAGHEPTSSSSIKMLTGAHVRFPTACLARIDFTLPDWHMIRPGSGVLQWMIPPRLL